MKNINREKPYYNIKHINEISAWTIAGFSYYPAGEVIEEKTDGENFSAELVGLCTDICVVSNALVLKANFPEADISVDSSCCAGVTPESHKNALKSMSMCQIEII